MKGFIIERLAHVRADIEPLLEDHYKEVAMYQDKIKLNVDWKAYELLEKNDKLRIMTWRENMELIGYNVFFLNQNAHYQDHLYAVNDIIYVRPDHRGPEVKVFIDACEQAMVDEGVSVITYHMKEQKPFHALMEWAEYDHAEHVYMKYIGS